MGAENRFGGACVPKGVRAAKHARHGQIADDARIGGARMAELPQQMPRKCRCCSKSQWQRAPGFCCMPKPSWRRGASRTRRSGGQQQGQHDGSSTTIVCVCGCCIIIGWGCCTIIGWGCCMYCGCCCTAHPFAGGPTRPTANSVFILKLHTEVCKGGGAHGRPQTLLFVLRHKPKFEQSTEPQAGI